MKIIEKKLKTFISFCLSFSFLVFINAQELAFKYLQKTNPHDYIILNHVNVIPMDSMNKILSNRTVIIHKGIIQEISTKVALESNYPKSLVIDASGKYLIPGLHDMHSHFFNKDDLLLFVANGVTTTRCMNGEDLFLDFKDEITKNKILGPTLFVSSPTIADFSEDVEVLNTEELDDTGFEYVSTAEESIKLVKYHKQEGYDYIKIFNELNPEVLSAIFQEANNQQIKVVGHVNIGIDPIAMHQHSIEHLVNSYFKDSVKLRNAAQSDVWLCPTLSMYVKQNTDSANNRILIRYASKQLMREWKRWGAFYKADDENQLYILKDYQKMGGKIIAGTDCRLQYVIPGFSIHSEMELMVKYGLTPYEALKSATYNAADCLSRLKTSGTINLGKTADLVLLNENPFVRISNTKTIEAVLLHNQWISKKEIHMMLNDIAEKRKF